MRKVQIVHEKRIYAWAWVNFIILAIDLLAILIKDILAGFFGIVVVDNCTYNQYVGLPVLIVTSLAAFMILGIVVVGWSNFSSLKRRSRIIMLLVPVLLYLTAALCDIMIAKLQTEG